MPLITITDKTALDPQTSHINQFWAADFNELKDIINKNAQAQARTAAQDLLFDSNGGYIHGGTSDLVTTGVTVDETGFLAGTWVMFYYSGAVNPTITGASGTVTSYHNITTAGIYECWLEHKGNGDYSLRIPQAGGTGGTGGFTNTTWADLVALATKELGQKWNITDRPYGNVILTGIGNTFDYLVTTGVDTGLTFEIDIL